tara:strand:- start:342 stop:1076 length:735 start_codon:yes stop_codon:yes gene_type:complete
MSNILVIGESCKDIYCYGSCDRLAPEAPIPVFNLIEQVESSGMAMNVQRNIIALGQSCDIVTNNNWKQVIKTRYVHKNTNQMFIRIDKNDDKIERYNVKTIPLLDYKIIIISDYCKGFLTEEDIQFIASNHECVFLDTKKNLGSWCKNIKFIKINNYEYDKTKNNIPADIKNKLIVTMGPKGCKYKDKIYPVKSVEIKDVSGAGDTFLSGLIVNYSITQNIEESIKYANECATVVVQKRGVSIV